MGNYETFVQMYYRTSPDGPSYHVTVPLRLTHPGNEKGLQAYLRNHYEYHKNPGKHKGPKPEG